MASLIESEKRPVHVVLVTGSSGFLGQHIVRLLQEGKELPTVREIRLLDTRPYRNSLGHGTSVPMKETVASVCNAQAVKAAFEGVDCVIHCASLIDVGFFPDAKLMEEVNVQGTRNVIEACVDQNVSLLVFTGTVSTDHNPSSKRECSEMHCYPGPYGETKQNAAKLVMAASGRVLANGKTRLRTLILRQTPIYGEQDQMCITHIMQYAGLTMNKLVKVGKGFQIMYVGNAASAHLCGLRALSENPKISGRAFTITDDTPADMYEFMRPFLACRGFDVFPIAMPYPVALLLSILLTLLLVLVRPFFKLWTPLMTPSAVTYACYAPFLDGSDARVALSYKPRFSVEECVRRSLPYYRTVKL
ncbi:unnamed protein product [Ixodes persulcatus]